jgi:anti-anti-sigma factor
MMETRGKKHMNIEIRRRGAVDVVMLRGASAADGDAALLRGEIERLLDAGESLFILDLSGVNRVDSAFLGELVAGRERARKHDGVMKLVMQGELRDYFLLTRMDLLFEIFDDEEEALDSFVGENTTAGIP